MMTQFPRWTPIALMGAATFLFACGNGDDDGVAVPLADASTALTTMSDARITPALVRVANWSADLASSIDVCLSAPGAESFQGPVLGLANTYASVMPGVSYRQVSSYTPIMPGSYDIRFVTAGADCSQGVGPDLLNLTFAGATATTLAIMGQSAGSDPATALLPLALPDDQIISSSKAAIRFINALPSVVMADKPRVDAPMVDFGVGITDVPPPTFKPYYVGVPFGGISTKAEAQIPTQSAPASVDGHGYGSVSPLSSANPISAHQSGMVRDLAASQVDVAGGAAVTIVLLPVLCSAASADSGCVDSAGLAVYVDNAAIDGPLAPCLTCGADGGM